MEPDQINLEDDDAEFREHAPQPTRNISGSLDDEEQPDAGLSEHMGLDNQLVAEQEAREAASGDRMSHIEQKYAPTKSPTSVVVSLTTSLTVPTRLSQVLSLAGALLAYKLQAFASPFQASPSTVATRAVFLIPCKDCLLCSSHVPLATAARRRHTRGPSESCRACIKEKGEEEEAAN
jgi:hypothetical protein